MAERAMDNESIARRRVEQDIHLRALDATGILSNSQREAYVEVLVRADVKAVERMQNMNAAREANRSWWKRTNISFKDCTATDESPSG